jgi:hypothetical protein
LQVVHTSSHSSVLYVGVDLAGSEETEVLEEFCFGASLLTEKSEAALFTF